MALADVLNGLRSSLTATFGGSEAPAPGEPVTAVIRPELGTVEVAEVLTGQLDLTWVTKEVVFDDPDVESNLSAASLNAATIGSQPIGGGTPFPQGGTAGVLGTLRGAIPFATSLEIPINARVTWQVLDQAGNVLTSGEQFRAPNGLSGTEVTVLFAPALVAEGAGSEPVTYKLRATVTLSAGDTTVDPITLPDLEVPVPAVPVPTVVAMFIHSNFQARDGDDDGAALIVVPPGSPLAGLAQLQSLLDRLQSTLGAVSSLGRFATFLLGISELGSALTAHRSANVQFRVTGEISNLNDITLIQRAWYENDTEAEDELSSIILIGFEGTEVRFWKHRDFEGDNFTLRTGDGHLAIARTLHGGSPTAEFGSVSDGSLQGLGDELSAIRLL